MNDPFDSPRRLINRARKHSEEIEGEMLAFRESQPYSVFVEQDTRPGYVRHVLKRIKPFPGDVAIILSDLFKNLRSALDHAVYSATVLSVGGDPSGTKFPFGTDEANLESDIKKRCRDVPPTILDAIRALKPYKGGNDLLFCLNKIRNRKDHRVLIEPGIETHKVQIRNFVMNGPLALFPTSTQNSKDQVVIMSVGPGGSAQYDLQFSSSITLRDIPGLEGLHVGTFEDLIIEVEGAVRAIERAARI